MHFAANFSPQKITNGTGGHVQGKSWHCVKQTLRHAARTGANSVTSYCMTLQL